MSTTQTKIEVATWSRDDLNKLPTTSAKIRFLHSKGESKTEISKILNIRYQHVRNVLNQILKKA